MSDPIVYNNVTTNIYLAGPDQRTPFASWNSEPWSRTRFDHTLQLEWLPLWAIELAMAAILNGMIVIAAVRNKHMYAEAVAYASNSLYFALWVGNATFMFISLCVLGIVWLTGGWDKGLCTFISACNGFFVSFSVILASVITGERIYMVYILRRMPVKMVTTLLALAVVGSLASVAAVAFSGPFIYLNGLTCNFTGYISWVGILNFCILGVSATYLIGGSCACYWRLAHIASFKAKMELRKSLAPSTFGGPGGNEAATSAESATPISREARVQRSLAIRGALTSIVLCMTMVPLASVLVVWMRSGMTGPWQLELAINFSIPAAQLLDPLIVISMNSKFREAMRETYFRWDWQWWKRRRSNNKINGPAGGNFSGGDPPGLSTYSLSYSVVPMPAAKVAAAAAAATVASSVLF